MADSPIDKLLPLLKGVRPRGEGKSWSALCPAHADGANSLGVAVGRDDKVILKCYAGCDNRDIVKAVGLEIKDLFPGGRERKVPKNAGCTLARLAFEKRLPTAHLTAHGLRDDMKGSKPVVRIPYRDVDGSLLFERDREGPTGGESIQPPRVPLRLYGLWRLDEFRALKRLILTEGETDPLVLWYHGYPAVGVPGASALGSFDAKILDGFDEIYVWQEPDKAGGKMIVKLREKLAGRDWKVIRHDVAKDPADLHMADPDKFKERMDACLAAAAPPGDPPAGPAGDPADGSREGGAKGRFEFTDLGNARRLVAKHGADLRYDTALKTWYVWDKTRWAPDETEEIVRRMKDTVCHMYIEAAGLESAERRMKLVQHAQRSESLHSISAAIKLAQSEPSVPMLHRELDADAWLFNCLNGTVDLRTGAFRPHSRADLITQMCPVEFDPMAKCPLWDDALALIFPRDPMDPTKGGDADMIGYVQRLFGVCLTGSVEAVLPIFWGEGANGKSLTLNTVQRVMGRDYAMQAPRNLLMSKRHESHPTELADLDRKRLVISSETQQGRRLDEALVKELTGGERVRARKMRQDFYEFDPTHKLIMATNHRPRIPSGGHGIWRRVLLVPFNVKFWDPNRKESGPSHLKQDGTLPDRLKAESPGILAWMVRGCLEWQKGGLNTPTSVVSETDEYQRSEDLISQFLAECTEPAAPGEGGVLFSAVYAAYLRWCGENREHPNTKHSFTPELRKRSVVVERGTGNQLTCKSLRLVRHQQTTSFEHFDE